MNQRNGTKTALMDRLWGAAGEFAPFVTERSQRGEAAAPALGLLCLGREGCPGVPQRLGRGAPTPSGSVSSCEGFACGLAPAHR